MVQENHDVLLNNQEQGRLSKMNRAGMSLSPVATRARILLKDRQGWAAPRAAVPLDISQRALSCVERP